MVAEIASYNEEQLIAYAKNNWAANMEKQGVNYAQLHALQPVVTKSYRGNSAETHVNMQIPDPKHPGQVIDLNFSVAQDPATGAEHATSSYSHYSKTATEAEKKLAKRTSLSSEKFPVPVTGADLNQIMYNAEILGGADGTKSFPLISGTLRQGNVRSKEKLPDEHVFNIQVDEVARISSLTKEGKPAFSKDETGSQVYFDVVGLSEDTARLKKVLKANGLDVDAPGTAANREWQQFEQAVTQSTQAAVAEASKTNPDFLKQAQAILAEERAERAKKQAADPNYRPDGMGGTAPGKKQVPATGQELR